MYSVYPSGPNQLAAIQRWPAHTVEPVYSGHPSGPNQLAAIQRWPAHTVEPVYSVHPSSWLLYRGGLLIQCNLCIVSTPQDPTSWLHAIQRWPAHTVYSGHPSGPNQLAAIQRWPAHSGTQPVGCYAEVACMLIHWNLSPSLHISSSLLHCKHPKNSS